MACGMSRRRLITARHCWCTALLALVIWCRVAHTQVPLGDLQLSTPLGEIAVNEGSSAVIVCSFTSTRGVPRITVKKTSGDVASDYSVVMTSGTGSAPLLQETAVVLLQRVTARSAGTYQCTARNDVGPSALSWRVDVMATTATTAFLPTGIGNVSMTTNQTGTNTTSSGGGGGGGGVVITDSVAIIAALGMFNAVIVVVLIYAVLFGCRPYTHTDTDDAEQGKAPEMPANSESLKDTKNEGASADREDEAPLQSPHQRETTALEHAARHEPRKLDPARSALVDKMQRSMSLPAPQFLKRIRSQTSTVHDDDRIPILHEDDTAGELSSVAQLPEIEPPEAPLAQTGGLSAAGDAQMGALPRQVSMPYGTMAMLEGKEEVKFNPLYIAEEEEDPSAAQAGEGQTMAMYDPYSHESRKTSSMSGMNATLESPADHQSFFPSMNPYVLNSAAMESMTPESDFNSVFFRTSSIQFPRYPSTPSSTTSSMPYGNFELQDVSLWKASQTGDHPDMGHRLLSPLSRSRSLPGGQLLHPGLCRTARLPKTSVQGLSSVLNNIP